SHERVLFGVDSRKKSHRFEGVIPMLERWIRNDVDDDTDAPEDAALTPDEARVFLREVPCEVCGGKRLRPEALAVTVDGQNVAELGTMELGQLRTWLEKLPTSTALSSSQQQVALPLVNAMKQRLSF